MADIRGIELASEIYGLEDTSARNTATAASQTATQAGQTATQASQTATQASQTATQASQTETQADSTIGTLANLETTAKTDLVSAINEVNGKVDDWEDITSQIVKTALIEFGDMILLRKGKIIYFEYKDLALTPQGALQNQTLASGFPPPMLDWLCIPGWGENGAYRPLSIRDNGTLSSSWPNQVKNHMNGCVMYKTL